MVSNETRLETLKKQIAKRETLIKSESEKLKNDKKKLEQLETAVMSEYMTKEGIFLLYQKTLYQLKPRKAQ